MTLEEKINYSTQIRRPNFGTSPKPTSKQLIKLEVVLFITGRIYSRKKNACTTSAISGVMSCVNFSVLCKHSIRRSNYIQI